MSGYLLQKRDRPRAASFSVESPIGSSHITERFDLQMPDVQETYSFRSGKLGPNENDTLVEDSKIYRPSGSYYGDTDTGHTFWTQRSRFLSTNHPNGSQLISGYFGESPDRRVSGPLLLSLGYSEQSQLMPTVSLPSDNDVKVWGSQLIAASRPSQPNASLVTALGELLHDGLPSMVGSALFAKHSNFRSFGSEYLNVEFGIKPLLKDIFSICNAVKKSSRIVAQMEHDSGRYTRRRRSLPPERNVTEQVRRVPAESAFFGPYQSYVNSSNGFRNQTVTDVTSRDVWFAGAFSSYTDPGVTLVGKFKRYEALANELLGTRLTAETIWNLAPWSWLVDWVSDVGSVISNATELQEDGLVIKYGYLMVKTTTIRTVTAEGWFQGQFSPISVANTYVCERKERFRATPYGFGLKLEGFTPRQWAILGSLGLSSAPGRLSRA